MTKFKDLTGQTFDLLKVIERVENSKDNHIRYLCECTCGNFQVVYATKLRNKKITCCHTCSARKAQIKHGFRYTRIYNIWKSIKSRCYNVKSTNYKDYGGRGIVMCDEWKNNAKNFCNWGLANGYSHNLSIDRINVNGNYEPSNCRFVDSKTQARNKRYNVFIEYQNRIITASECAEIVGISGAAMCQRIRRHPNDSRIFEKQWKDEKWGNQHTILI